ncbi:ubiquinol-cytochrome C reductase [Filobasidium floriforme]|uniref:ubiquinol-cytochrome C reductase n=1 Tax=Filobasidium floriforme TaxID=5210 RepID=UPI001E8CF180|nr:ubiquinol-cytochrome C reductase [Filobasidium floriforme]KAH8087000.1 ubiquinol-cytochrome C reductase [Filobasidium floriforme]
MAPLFYNTFVRRNSVFVSSIFLGAFAFSITFDLATTAFWERHNRGKLWKDIRDKYVKTGEEED